MIGEGSRLFGDNALEIVQPNKSEAEQIGELYRLARNSIVNSMFYAAQCGERLRAKKAAIGHGNWLNWLEINEEILGFGRHSAERLIKHAKGASTLNLTESQALIASRQLWSNETTAAQLDQARTRRAQREVDLAGKLRALPDKKYGVIYADPEWRFDTYSDAGKLRTNPDNHFPTSALEDILARNVSAIASDDCVLFLWSTVPVLDQALIVMATWGFRYKSAICWVKDKMANGFWSRGQWEPLLIGTRGLIPAPAPGEQFPSVVYAERGRHSEKPDQFADMIMEKFPNLPKIELNARKRRDGWDAWGLEAPE